MLQRFPTRYARVSPWVFFVWLVTVVIAGMLVIFAENGAMGR